MFFLTIERYIKTLRIINGIRSRNVEEFEKIGFIESPYDELDWSLNLNDFELNLIRDFISDGISPDDEKVEFSDISPVIPQHQSKSPENSAPDATPPAIDVARNLDLTASQCNEVVSGGKDRRAPTIDKEAFTPSLARRRYRGVRPQPGGRFSAEINLYPEKKGKNLWLGTYDTEEEAAMAFDRAAFKYRGSRAVLNFPRC